MKGRITITDAPDSVGSVFQVLLPGKLIADSGEKKAAEQDIDDESPSVDATKAVGAES